MFSVKKFISETFAIKCWMMVVALLVLFARSGYAHSESPLTKLNTLLNTYNNSKDGQRLHTGEQLLDYCSAQAVFFDKTPSIAQDMPAWQQDVCVWFAAERYLTTNAFYKEALNYIEKALSELAQRNRKGNDLQGIHETLLCDQAYCLFKTSDYTASVEAGRAAMRLCQQTGNILQLSRAYLYLSLVNHALRKYDEAKSLVVKAIETNEQLGDNVQLHNALGIACEIFCSAKEINQAIDYGKRAVEAARKLDYLPGVANHLTQLSYAYDRRGDYELGLQMANEAIAIVQQQEPLDRNQLALTLEYKSWNLIDIGRHAEAVEALREAIRLEEELGNTHAAWYDYRTLAEAMAPIDARGALNVLNQYVRMSDSIHSEQLKELMSQANAEFHNDELQEANIQSRRTNRIILAASLIIVLLLVAAIASLWFAFRQKQRSAALLHRLIEARESFFTNVTHEFRTPLTVLLGVGKELQEEVNAPAFIALGDTIERNSTRLLTLINQLLDISKVKSAIGPQTRTQGDLASYVGMVVEAQREIARKKDVAIDFETDPEGIMTEFAPDYVEKVVGNLLSNAVKFTPEGGKVTIALHRQDKHLVLTVEDTGKGIAAADLPHIFEPFYQAADTSGQGTGVGLTLVHQIIEALQGEITVKSEVGKGTTFKVIIRPTTKTLPPPSPVLEGSGSTGAFSLLIVEDNADVAHLIGRQLAGRYDIHYASDGEEGIRQARELVPDLIITDLMMPHTDGLQLCRTLRNDPITNHIPLIVITAKATDEDRIQGLQAGADAYLCKPFNAEELNVRIEKLLETRKILREKYSSIDHVPSTMQKDVIAPTIPFTAQSTDFMQHVHDTIIHTMTEGPCTVETIAEKLCVSPSQLRRKMNAITGIPPKKYIIKVRMEMAHDLLQHHPNMKIAHIAERCGFYDLSHFIRFYKETYGTTPAADKQATTN